MCDRVIIVGVSLVLALLDPTSRLALSLSFVKIALKIAMQNDRDFAKVILLCH
jgi:hypothetical protein